MKLFLKLIVLSLSLLGFSNLNSQTLYLDSLYSFNGYHLFETEGVPRTKEFYELSNGEKLICGYEYTYYGPPTPPSETYTHMIIKYDECGNLDSSYGNNGRFKSDNFVSELRISTKDFLLLNDESLLMCGHNFNIYYSDSLNNEYVYTYGPILYKITPAGISDPNFITHDIESYFNVVSWTFNTCAEFILTEELNDGKIFCAGSYTEYSDNGIILTKFNSNGSFDSTYHGNGILKIPLNMNGLKILETHRIESDQLLFIGRVDGNYLVSFITNNDGALDLSYGQSGYAIDSSTTLNSFDIFNSKIITEFKNNKLYVGYNDIVTNSSGFVISRYLNNGQLDSTFGLNGKSVVSFSNTQLVLIGFDILDDNRILVGVLREYIPVSGFTYMLDSLGQIDSSIFNNGVLEGEFNGLAGAFEKAIELQNGDWIFAGANPSGSLISRYSASLNVPHVQIVDNIISSGVNSTNVSFQWYFNGILESDSINSTFTSPTNGVYIVVVTDTSSCGTYSDTLSLNTTSLPFSINNDLYIYPNPTNKLVSIKCDIKHRSCQIYNEYGLLCDEFILNSGITQIDISKLKNGLYFFKFNSGEVRKIIIENDR